jgi:hypothetical protein
MLKPTDSPAPSLQPRFAASARDDRPAALAEQAPRLARGRVRGMRLVDARAAEERDRGPVDLVDLGETAAELVRDPLDGPLGVGKLGVEDLSVVHYRRSWGR